MAKNTGANAMYKTDRVVSSREKVFNVIVFILLLLLAVVMVFPLVYMVLTSFMTKNQILSGRLTLIPNPVLIGKYSEVLSKGQFINGILNTVKVEIQSKNFGRIAAMNAKNVILQKIREEERNVLYGRYNS